MDVLQAWRNLLGDDRVLLKEEVIGDFQTATFATHQKILAIIQPSNTEEVQSCVKIANEYQVPLYPISRGKNWGLGSRVPVKNNSVILDLSKLDQIIDYQEKLAYITIEPGVTFRRVHEYLRSVNSPLFVSVIGGSPDASLIGNTLERGDGIGPYGDRLSHACGLEVVLPTGEIIHTGFGRFGNNALTPIDRWGVGPYLDGIFTQSNLGIVTKMTMWLMPKPKFLQTFTCFLKNSSRLELLIDTIQTLILQGTIAENCFYFWNSYKVLAKEGRYPWKLTNGKTPLSLQELKGSEPWMGSGQLYTASREQGLAIRQIIESMLAHKVDRLWFLDSDQEPNLLIDGFDVGVPSDANVKSVYWRKKTKTPSLMNPDGDRCGVIWLCPVFPFTGQAIIGVIPKIESIIQAYGFEPNLALSCTSARIVRMFIAIMYDREVTGEDQKASDCHDQLLEVLLEYNYFPYRLGINSMKSLPQPQDDYNFLLNRIKQTLDPQNILALGRYGFENY